MSGRNSTSTLKNSMFFLSTDNERGIMLVDILLGLAFTLVLIAILQQVASVVMKGYMNSCNQADIQYSLRSVFDSIQEDVRTAQGFQVSAGGNQLNITTTDGENIIIYAQNGNLYRKYKTSVPIAENISAVNFVKYNSVLQCNLKLNSENTEYEIDFFSFSRISLTQE